MDGMDMSGMSANTNNLTVAVLNSSSFSMSGSSTSTTAQCSPMLDGLQFAFGSSSGSSSPCVLYIFPGANVDTPFKYAIAVLGTFLAALCYEMLRARREQMTTALQRTSTSSPSSTSLPSSSLPRYDILVAVLYTLQTMLGYFLMMLVMTFDIDCLWQFLLVLVWDISGCFVVNEPLPCVKNPLPITS